MKGRPPLPVGQARSARLEVRIRPGGAEKFRAVAKRRNMTEADALRQAVAEWTNRSDK